VVSKTTAGSGPTGYERPLAARLEQRLREPRRFIQVVTGPRQVGKTTLVRQATARIPATTLYATADEPELKGREWLEAQWNMARAALRDGAEVVLVLDEVQKLPRWSEPVKKLWDEDSAAKRNVKVVLLGSSPLLLQQGLTESLAGRFEQLRAMHWDLLEMRAAFGWNLDKFINFGGYPGAAPLIDEPERWARYIKDSLIETTLSRDILLLTRIDKPALLRQSFELACRYSAQVLSYQKMLGQLHDAGNTVTLAHYLQLLRDAGLVMGFQKFTGSSIRERGSSPKLQVLNNALLTVSLASDPASQLEQPHYRGRLIESAVGAMLANLHLAAECELFYWKERGYEVDFVVRVGKRLFAIEVKSGRPRESRSGLAKFLEQYRKAEPLLVGTGGIEVEEFLTRPLEGWG
jgi:hypothetical protein